MTLEQQSALEALVARALTADEIAAIEPLLATRNDVAIAAALSEGRQKLCSHMIGERGILDTLGPVDGEAFLSALESIASADMLPEAAQPYFGALKRGVAWLKTDGIDVGSETTRELLNVLVAAGSVSELSVKTLKALAMKDDPVSVADVSEVLNHG